MSTDQFRDAAGKVQERAVATVTECEACFTPDVCQLRGTCDHYRAELLRVAARALPEQVAWLREQRDEYEGPATLAPLMLLGDVAVKPHTALHGATYEPLYSATALADAVAAERERIRSKLLEMHERDKHRHNYWHCAVVKLFGS